MICDEILSKRLYLSMIIRREDVLYPLVYGGQDRDPPIAPGTKMLVVRTRWIGSRPIVRGGAGQFTIEGVSRLRFLAFDQSAYLDLVHQYLQLQQREMRLFLSERLVGRNRWDDDVGERAMHVGQTVSDRGSHGNPSAVGKNGSSVFEQIADSGEQAGREARQRGQQDILMAMRGIGHADGRPRNGYVGLIC